MVWHIDLKTEIKFKKEFQQNEDNTVESLLSGRSGTHCCLYLRNARN